jgi:hypothetical protein
MKAILAALSRGQIGGLLLCRSGMKKDIRQIEENGFLGGGGYDC